MRRWGVSGKCGGWDGSDRGGKRENNEEVELSIDLLADEFVPSQQDMASGNILRDGLNVFV